MRRLLFLCIAGALALAAGIVLFTYLYERPNNLHVAVVRGSEDQEIMTVAAQDFVHERESLRLTLLPVDNFSAAADALDEGHADLAIVRSDIDMPSTGQTILIMRRSAALFLAPAKAGIHSVADLRGHKLGLVHEQLQTDAKNQNLLETILEQYGVLPSEVSTLNLPASEIEKALAAGTIDAVLALGMPGSPALNAAVVAVSKASDGKPVFIPIPEAEGIAQRSPNYEAIEIVKGLFPGLEPQPDESFHTLAVSTRLVARSSLSDTIAGDLTRILLAARPRIAVRVPIAARIVAPATDKGAVLPIHPGALAFLDDENESFFEKYSDAFYIGAMVLSVLGSALAAVASRLSKLHREGACGQITRLVEILNEARDATHNETLQALDKEADAILAQSLLPGFKQVPDLGTLSLIIDQVRHAINARRKQLAAGRGFEPRLVKDGTPPAVAG